MSLADEIYLPFSERGLDLRSEALEDFYIRCSEWVNYVGSVILLLGHCTELSGEPRLRVPAPLIRGHHEELEETIQRLPKSLSTTAWTQLSTTFDVYLSELASEALRLNPELLSIDEKQLTTSEILELGSFDEIKERLIQRWTFRFGMESYPVKAERMQSKFRIGIHSNRSPMELFDVHDFVEVRNVLVHTGGHATSSQYHDRMRHYGRNTLIRSAYGTVATDFKWLMNFAECLAELCCFIDKEMRAKWTLTTGTV